jgi:hypothetical protein
MQRMQEKCQTGGTRPRCPFRKSDARRTSCLRKPASSPHAPRLLDSRLRGHDARPQGLAVNICNGHLNRAIRHWHTGGTHQRAIAVYSEIRVYESCVERFSRPVCCTQVVISEGLRYARAVSLAEAAVQSAGTVHHIASVAFCLRAAMTSHIGRAFVHACPGVAARRRDHDPLGKMDVWHCATAWQNATLLCPSGEEDCRHQPWRCH